MAYVIAEPCIDHMDQTCVQVCPVDCISFDPDFDRKLHIDPDACIDCGSCEASCPNDAIFRADKLPRRELPDWLARLLALFNADLRGRLGSLGVVKEIDGRAGEALLGHPYISPAAAVVAMGRSLVEQKLA